MVIVAAPVALSAVGRWRRYHRAQKVPGRAIGGPGGMPCCRQVASQPRGPRSTPKVSDECERSDSKHDRKEGVAGVHGVATESAQHDDGDRFEDRHGLTSHPAERVLTLRCHGSIVRHRACNARPNQTISRRGANPARPGSGARFSLGPGQVRTLAMTPARAACPTLARALPASWRRVRCSGSGVWFAASLRASTILLAMLSGVGHAPTRRRASPVRPWTREMSPPPRVAPVLKRGGSSERGVPAARAELRHSPGR